MKTLEELQEIRNRIFNQVDMRQDNAEKTIFNFTKNC